MYFTLGAKARLMCSSEYSSMSQSETLQFIGDLVGLPHAASRMPAPIARCFVRTT
jgi:hypothetical protein